MFNYKLFMYCRISQRWLFSSIIDIEMGNSTIQDVCKCIDMVDSIQPTSISIDIFYNALSFYNIKMNLKPERHPQTQDEATIIQLISDIPGGQKCYRGQKYYPTFRTLKKPAKILK